MISSNDSHIWANASSHPSGRHSFAGPPSVVESRAVRSLRVLLVDDHADCLRAMTRHLEYSGHTVRVSYDAAGALAWIAAEPFDIMVSDIALPDMDGYEMMRLIRSCGNMPSIALSGYAGSGDAARSFEAGYSIHLSKPVDMVHLEEMLQRLSTDESQ